MKKHVALFLALLFALGLAAPALAYTNNAAPQQDESPYKVDIYLVEYADGDQLSSWLSMPPSDRGYAKNEVIAAIGVLTVPANHSAYGDYYQHIRFTSKNILLKVAENKPYYSVLGNQPKFELESNLTASVPGWLDGEWVIDQTNDNIYYPLEAESAESAAARTRLFDPLEPLKALPVFSEDKTYRFLVFGRILDDDASLTFALTRTETWSGVWFWTNSPHLWYDLVPYITPAIMATPDMGVPLTEEMVLFSQVHPYSSFETVYYVFENPLQSLGFAITNRDLASASTPGQLMFAIETGAWGKTERLYMYPRGAGAGKTEYRVHVEPSTQELVFIITNNPPAGKATNDQVIFGTAGYNSLLAFYKEWFEDKLGFSAYNEGNLLTADDWAAILAAVIDVSVTVDIQPWTPYVSVPDNIVTDPPKTGSAPLFAVYGVALMACAAGVWVMLRRRAMHHS